MQANFQGVCTLKKNLKTNAEIKKAFDELMQKNSENRGENKSNFSPLRRVIQE
jgi:hypothetical protein